jgi:DNA polymerase III sliding clamp (beta) subunit (PCNA family)
LPFHHALNLSCDVEGEVEMWVGNGKEAYAFRLSQIAENFEDGMVVIPAAEFIRAVQAAPEAEVRIEVGVGEDVAHITSGTARWNIEALTGVEYGYWVGDFEAESDGTIHGGELVRMLENTRYAASKNENRPSFMQVHVDEQRVIASDGRRVHSETSSRSEGVPAFNIPERDVDTLLEALSVEGTDEEHDVYVTVTDDGQMTFGYRTMQYTVGRLNYPFPKLDSLVFEQARAQTSEVVTSVQQFVTGIKVASVAIEDGGAVQLRFTNGVIEVKGVGARFDGRMEVRASTKDIVSGFTISVIASDLLEMLGRVHEGDGDVVFTIGNDPDDPGWVYVRTEEGMEAAIRPVVA